MNLFYKKTMKITNRLERIIKGAKTVFVAGLICFSSVAMAQTKGTANENPYVKLGQKALLDGDYKTAVNHLKKALPADPENSMIMYTIGYSEFQLGNYKDATDYFSKVIEKTPDNSSAFYYRGKSRSNEAVMHEKMSDSQRANLLQASIEDFSKAIELDASDMKSFQNRGMAYRDLGNLLGTKTSKNHNKKAATDAYNNCIKDLKVVIAKNPNRKDLSLELKKATVYRDNLK